MDKTTREGVLDLLEQHRGALLSGSEIGEALGISRAAVWKAIRSLREDGHKIDAVTNRGYGLSEESDQLTVAGILVHLRHREVEAHMIHIRKQTGSTNQDAKALALEGAAHGAVLLADEQTAGRGRLGRSFHSPKGTGLYLSMVLRPGGTLAAAVPITQAAAVAVCRALSVTTGLEASIKWVNDLYIGGKKVCGILTEAVSDFETGHIEALILGIGINVAQPTSGFPPELSGLAGTLADGAMAHTVLADGAMAEGGSKIVSRNRLAATIIDELLDILPELETLSFLEEYRRRCFILGQRVTVQRGNDSYEAIAVSIDASGGLVVETDDNKRLTLNSGEVSLVLNKGDNK
jgi:BirA family biotin operon repressor/biotin-[acetyl-CoA-carboxylase] ligase